MAQEHIFSDFSGGMNALSGVDKLDPKECLLAENVRLDETGNIQSAGAFTHQNTSAYAAVSGTNTNNAHSLYWNPSLGAVSGVGQDVFFGPTLGGQGSGLAGKNASQQKMSFASAPGRVYFDVGSVGYWTDITNLLTVDWAPPSASGATVTGPTTVGTGSNDGGGGAAWANPNNITSTNSNTFADVTITTATGSSQQLRATMTTNSFSISTAAVTGIGLTFQAQHIGNQGVTFIVSLMKGGIPIGNAKTYNITSAGSFTVNLGNANDLWGSTWAQGDINAGNFGFQVRAQYFTSGVTIDPQIYKGQLTVYQGSGFFAGGGTTGILTGTYTWKVTFVAANGEESDGSGDSASVALASQQGTLTAIPTGDARTTARNIYRKGNALTSHYLVGTLQDNSSTTYSDNQTDIAALTEGVILAGDVPGDYPNTRLGSQQVRFPVYHYDRVFWIIPGTNQLIWSKPLDGFAYPVVNQTDVGDSKPCVRAVSIFGELIIFKTDSIWRLTGTDEASFDLSQTPSAVGSDQPFTIVALPDKVIFANRYGLWAFNGYTSQPLTPKLDLWFKQDDRTNEELYGVNGFHPPEVASTTVPLGFEAVGNSEKYIWAYAEAGQSSNNAILIFDVKHANITKRTTGTALPLSLAIDPVNGFVYMGDNQGFVSLLDDWNGANGGGTPANFDFQTGYMDLQRGSNKALWALEFFLDTDGQSLTPYVYYDNGAASEALAPVSTTALQRVLRQVQSGNSRKMQNFSVRFNGSINPVNVTGSPQIQIVHIKAYYDIRTGKARTGQ